MAELIFKEDTHQYFLDGKELPSLTRIIKPLVDFSMVPPDILAKAAAFGTAVHKTVELYLAGTLDRDTLDENLVPCLDAFEAFLIAFPQFAGREVVAERPMAYPRMKFAGTPDLIYDGFAVVELKTRKVNPLTDPIQVAAQERLWLANGGTKGTYSHHVLELLPGGKWELKTFTKKQIDEGWRRFRYLLDYHYAHQTIQSWRSAA